MENNFDNELANDMIKFIDNVVRKNFRSRYMVTLYEEKLGKSGVTLTEKEVDDYLLNCAVLSATADVLLPFYPKLLSIIPVDKLNKQGIASLNHQMKVYNGNTSMEEQQEILKSNHPYRAWDFGKYDRNRIINNLDIYGYKISNYNELCDKMFFELMGGSVDRKSAQENLDKMVSAVDHLCVSDQKILLDKVSICYGFGTTMSVTTALADKDYSMMKYPNDAEWMNKMDDYKSLLEKFGIDMGELPKNFIDEIYGRNGRSVNH